MDIQVKPLLKITVQRDALLKALTLIARFAPKQSVIPILGGVLIRADGDVLLTGTNLDQTVNVPLKASTGAVGAVVVSAHSLHQLIKGLPKGAVVELSHESTESPCFVVRSGASQFQLPVRSPDDFPVEPLNQVKTTFTIPAVLLRELIAKTKIAISTEETRFYLNGVCLNVEQRKGVLYAVSTDGHRMAEFSIPLPAGAAKFKFEGQAGLIIPRDAILELEKALARETSDVTVKLFTGDSQESVRVTFTVPGWDIITKVIDGTFPDWKRVMPDAEGLPSLRFDSTAAQALLANVRMAHGADAKHGRAVRLTVGDSSLLQIGTTQPLTMDCTGFDSESNPVTASGEIPAAWNGREIEIGFNGRYLAEILALIPRDASMSISDAESPVTITDPADPRITFVLMPMRVC